MRRLLLLLVPVVLLLSPRAGAQDRPPLSVILARVTDYIVRYQKEISGVVAEERYVQDSDKSDRPFVTHRELKSDLLLVQTDAGPESYVQFRDVYDVDGEPVHDRTDRLQTLFMNPSADAKRQASQIMNESARYNIGSIQRNINVPLLTLMLLAPVYQPHFTYSAGTEHKGTPRGLPKTPAYTLASDAWEVDFDEALSPTLIKRDGRDAKSHGRIWIDPATSRVLITELVNEAKTVRSTIRVSYQSEPLAGVLLPVEMRETYVLKGRFYTFEGTATYSNYRRFTVNTVESIAKPPAR
jgi:hypothetical protein